MREIKFRAWDQNKGEMIQGYIYVQPSGRFVGHITESDDCIPMQYTGLKDKNGKEIYEGDIVKHFNDTYRGIIHTVVFKNGAFGYIVDDGRFISYADNMHFQITKTGESAHIEIIGNIYENPDLLK